MITDNLASCEASIKAPINKVWDALTVPEIVKKYFFGTDQQSTYKKGDAITWSGEYQGQKYKDIGEILECNAPHKLSYTYLSSFSKKEDKPENYLMVTYELVASGNGTVLKITFSSYSEEGKKHSLENWKNLIESLKKIVE